MAFGKAEEMDNAVKGNVCDRRHDFVKFLVDSEALVFGEFVLKSGRKSPYMINTGRFDTGPKLSRLGCFYAKAIREQQELGTIPSCIDVVFGAAYKGITLAAATSIAFSAAFDAGLGYCFNRKEEKGHGEGGRLVGRIPKKGDNIILVDDVMTAGTALRETMALLREEAPDANVVGCVISVDRKERGKDRLSATSEAEYEYGFPVFAIADADDIVSALRSDRLREPAYADAIAGYLAEYRACPLSEYR